MARIIICLSRIGFCAISSNAIIDRENAPKDISSKLVKSEFLVDELQKLIKLKKGMLARAVSIDSRPEFSSQELTSISQFLLANSLAEIVKKPILQPQSKTLEQPTPGQKTEKSNKPKVEVSTAAPKPELACKKCGEKQGLSASYGKYGYYVSCEKCAANTSMKIPCASCASKDTRVTKKREKYSLVCKQCEVSAILFTEAVAMSN